MLTTSAAYKQIKNDMTQALQRAVAGAGVAREQSYYLERISGIKSIDDFLSDRRVFAFAMEAHGLSDMTYAKAFMRRVLEGGTDDPKSFANKLPDRRFREFAETFNFKRYGTATTAFDRTQQGTVDRFARQKLEQQAGETNEGVRLALYFERKAPKINSYYEILADRALYRVVATAFGLPESASRIDIDRQKEMLAARFDLADLRAPDKLAQIIARHTALWDTTHGAKTAGSAATFYAGGGVVGISESLLSTIQGLKLGGR